MNVKKSFCTAIVMIFLFFPVHGQEKVTVPRSVCDHHILGELLESGSVEMN